MTQTVSRGPAHGSEIRADREYVRVRAGPQGSRGSSRGWHTDADGHRLEASRVALRTIGAGVEELRNAVEKAKAAEKQDRADGREAKLRAAVAEASHSQADRL